MKKELQDKLFSKYPEIFKQHKLSMTETCMCWGIETGEGWYDIIQILCELLQWDIEKNHHPKIEASQVKEKFGTLRFYTSRPYEEYKTLSFRHKIQRKIYNFLRSLMLKFCQDLYMQEMHSYTQEGMIKYTEFLSAYICEECGSNKDVKQTEGWIVTLCSDCMKKRKEEKR